MLLLSSLLVVVAVTVVVRVVVAVGAGDLVRGVELLPELVVLGEVIARHGAAGAGEGLLEVLPGMLYYTMLYHTILYYTILYHTVS